MANLYDFSAPAPAMTDEEANSLPPSGQPIHPEFTDNSSPLSLYGSKKAANFTVQESAGSPLTLHQKSNCSNEDVHENQDPNQEKDS